MHYFLGLDVGTTGVKALLFTPQGERLGNFYQGYKLYTPFPDWVEQEPEEIWDATKMVLREVAKLIPPDGRLGIGVSSQGGTLIVLDEHFRPLRRAITWMDGRARGLERQLLSDWTQEELYEITGYKLVGALPFATLFWLREYEPEVFRNISRVAFVNDFITFKLTGSWCCDPSNAGISMLFDLQKGEWSERLLGYLGIDKQQLSSIHDSGSLVGKVLGEVRQELNLPPTLVFLGGHDQFCAALAVGAVEEGIVHLSGGTAWAAVVPCDAVRKEMEWGVAVERHVVPGKVGLLFSIPSGGASLRWFHEKIGRDAVDEPPVNEDYYLVDERVRQIAPGSEGLFFFPYLVPVVLGKPSPPEGGFWGLKLSHHKYHCYRSIMEGIGYEVVRQIENLVQRSIPVNVLRLSGGAAKSPVWTKIVAEILAGQGFALERVRIADAPAVGAAELACTGYQNWMKGKEKWEKPHLFSLAIDPISVEAENCRVYEERYRKYKEILENRQGR
ncbi:MAG: xylulokinase [Candidatus Caldatribacteriaceae bacterium]